MKQFKLVDYDVVFLSFDEPNAETNYQHLLKKIPWAKRVHGVKGSDTAHKECAKLSSTDRLIIVDGDNFVWGDFLNQIIELDESVDESTVVFSWPSKNSINGLLYGNGGIKCWPKKVILEMKTHENAEVNNLKTQIDFCWEIKYVPIDRCYSNTVNNSSPLQAFRAGFREGVKMALDKGYKTQKLSLIEKGNQNRLKIWLTVGADIEYGLYGILGAWHGLYNLFCKNFDYTLVRDFNFLNEYFEKNISRLSELNILDSINRIKESLLETNNCFEIINPFSKDQSKFFKSIYQNPYRQPREIISKNLYYGYDIVMITYDEPECEKNYEFLLRRFPNAKRIHGVKGIHQAHVEAAKIVKSEMFWVVDGDAIIVDNFNFDFYQKEPDDFVRVWRCKNPINDLIYGYGGVKLLPTEKTKNMSLEKPDMTTSISDKFIPVQQLSNITNFNISEFHTWRSAFRECCKLASKVIDRQKDEETIKRLDIWCTVGINKKFGVYCVEGAIAGRKYGEQNRNNIEALKKINDFEWLREIYDESYKCRKYIEAISKNC